MYHETFYGRIPERNRVRWHRQIGRQLEAGFGAQARERGADLQNILWGAARLRAVHYLRSAGEQAMQRCAYQEAVTFFEKAFETLQQLPTDHATQEFAIDLHLSLRSALMPLGGYERIWRPCSRPSIWPLHWGTPSASGGWCATWPRVCGCWETRNAPSR